MGGGWAGIITLWSLVWSGSTLWVLVGAKASILWELAELKELLCGRLCGREALCGSLWESRNAFFGMWLGWGNNFVVACGSGSILWELVGVQESIVWEVAGLKELFCGR